MHIAELFEGRAINGRKAIIRRSHHVYLNKHSQPSAQYQEIHSQLQEGCLLLQGRAPFPLSFSDPTSSNLRWLGTTHAVAIKYEHEKSNLVFLRRTAILGMARGGHRKEPSTGFLVAKLDCVIVCSSETIVEPLAWQTLLLPSDCRMRHNNIFHDP